MASILITEGLVPIVLKLCYIYDLLLKFWCCYSHCDLPWYTLPLFCSCSFVEIICKASICCHKILRWKIFQGSDSLKWKKHVFQNYFFLKFPLQSNIEKEYESLYMEFEFKLSKCIINYYYFKVNGRIWKIILKFQRIWKRVEIRRGLDATFIIYFFPI